MPSMKLKPQNYYGALTIVQDEGGRFYVELGNFDTIRRWPITKLLARRLAAELQQTAEDSYNVDERTFKEVLGVE